MVRRYTKKSEYAALAVLELAIAYPSRQPVSAQRIASKYGFSALFLMRILQDLHKVQLVEAVRGSTGGFRLIPAPEELTVGYVVSLIEGEDSSSTVLEARESTHKSNEDAKRSVNKMNVIWRCAEAARQEYLNSVVYSDLIQEENDGSTFNFSI